MGLFPWTVTNDGDNVLLSYSSWPVSSSSVGTSDTISCRGVSTLFLTPLHT